MKKNKIYKLLHELTIVLSMVLQVYLSVYMSEINYSNVPFSLALIFLINMLFLSYLISIYVLNRMIK
ncbi:hypothetical protein [Flavobacterium sp. HNIBRBA15423]|uniref:hypothetical protein n=1 Tax=Flavobacterium sp. HNIBRBA15423 TaxID=3458683 RepID=UPI0040448102